MKQMCSLILAAFITLFAVSAATAQQNYHQINEQGGVQVLARYNPFGHNNLIVAFIKFVNTNPYQVDVDWLPRIVCENLPLKKGYGAPFTLSPNKSYEVTVWRSQACGSSKLQGINVEMTVTKKGF